MDTTSIPLLPLHHSHHPLHHPTTLSTTPLPHHPLYDPPFPSPLPPCVFTLLTALPLFPPLHHLLPYPTSLFLTPPPSLLYHHTFHHPTTPLPPHHFYNSSYTLPPFSSLPTTFSTTPITLLYHPTTHSTTPPPSPLPHLPRILRQYYQGRVN